MGAMTFRNRRVAMRARFSVGRQAPMSLRAWTDAGSTAVTGREELLQVGRSSTCSPRGWKPGAAAASSNDLRHDGACHSSPCSRLQCFDSVVGRAWRLPLREEGGGTSQTKPGPLNGAGKLSTLSSSGLSGSRRSGTAGLTLERLLNEIANDAFFDVRKLVHADTPKFGGGDADGPAPQDQGRLLE